jgi:hypothetical protein
MRILKAIDGRAGMPAKKSAKKTTAKYLAMAARRPSLAQSLEQRLFLSMTGISDDISADPRTTVGNVSAYTLYENNGTVSETRTVTAIGPTTYNGQAAFESDTMDYIMGTTPETMGMVVATTLIRSYLGQTSDGFVDFGDTESTTNNGTPSTTSVISYSVPALQFPAELVVGQNYTQTYTTYKADTVMANGTTTDSSLTITKTGQLVSDSTQPITVPAGTYNCYEVTEQDVTNDGTDPPTTQDHTFYVAQGIGVVEDLDSVNGAAPSMEELTSFTDADRLVFTVQPSAVSAEDPIQPPITVELQDSSGDVNTDSTATEVTLSIVGVSSGNPITGNTAPLVNGVATFNDLVLSKAGVYQLQPSDDDLDTGPASDKFGVGGDQLDFSVQPKNVDADQPLTVSVKAMTPKGTLDTSATDSVELSLNTISGGTNAMLAGTLVAPLVGGVATFTPAAGVAINTAGSYTLTATAVTDNTGTTTDYTTTAATSSQFNVAGLQLVVTKQPATSADVGDPIAFTVSLENSKHQVATNENSAVVQIGLNTITGGTGAILGGTTSLTVVAGRAVFTPTAGPSINAPGAYTLSVSQSGVPAPAKPVTTKQFRIMGYTLEEASTGDVDPVTEDVMAGSRLPPFFLVDAKGKYVTMLSGLPYLKLTLNSISGSGALQGATQVSASSVYSYGVPVATFDFSAVGITLPGTYTLTATPVDAPGETIPAAAINAETTKPFKVLPYELALIQPRRVTANETFQASATLETNSHSTVLPEVNSWVGVMVSLITKSGGAGAQLTGDTAGPIGSDVGNQPLNLQITAPGTYELQFTEVISAANAPFDPSAATPVATTPVATTAPFKVLADFLVITQQPPAKIGAGNAFPVAVSIEDKLGNVITDINSIGTISGVQLTENTISGTSTNQLNLEADFVNGVATFSQVLIEEPGKYVLKASEVEFDTSLDMYEPELSPIVELSVPVVVTPAMS